MVGPSAWPSLWFLMFQTCFSTCGDCLRSTQLCDVRESATCLLDGQGLSVRKEALGLGPVSTV